MFNYYEGRELKGKAEKIYVVVTADKAGQCWWQYSDEPFCNGIVKDVKGFTEVMAERGMEVIRKDI